MFKFTTRGTVNFYMKSGNVIVADNINVDTFKYVYTGDSITKISGYDQKKPKNRVLLQALSLSQIEGIIVTNERKCLS